MTRFWHRLTSGAMGGCVIAAVHTGGLPSPYPLLPLEHVAGFFLLGIMLGASAPDWLEKIPLGKGRRRFSIPLFPHRTLTHWFLPWLAALAWAWWGDVPWMLRCVALGFTLSALLHLLMDSLSVQGVPALHSPMGRHRIGIPLYSTGRPSEGVCGVLVIAFMVFSSMFFMH